MVKITLRVADARLVSKEMQVMKLNILVAAVLLLASHAAHAESQRWIGLGVGAIAGFFLGTVIGGRVDHDASADDLNNVLVGGAVGAVVGGFAGHGFGKLASAPERASFEPGLDASLLARVASSVDPFAKTAYKSAPGRQRLLSRDL